MLSAEQFHELLTAEIQGDLAGVETFECDHHLTPYFHRYYSSYHSNRRKVTRTINGAVARRRHVSDFCEGLRRKCGPHPLVLDVGCGYGSDSLFLANLGCRVVGVDPSEEKIQVARHRARYWRSNLGDAPEPEFVSGFLEEMDVWAAGSFDGIFVAECLHHCEPVESVLLKMRELISDDGSVFVLESNAGSPVTRMNRDRAVEGPRRLLRRSGNRYVLYGNENIRSASQWRHLFRECGFEIRERQFARHLVSELFVSSALDATLCAAPGAGLASIHVSFELETRPATEEV
jgi:2-polyprenyl-3-methyl-5-hydroxy-6-metoxy-1,4-benzoquinol methylase